MLEMKVKTMMTDALDEYLADMATLDIDELYCSAEPLLSEDIWKKFEFDPLGDLADFDVVLKELDAMPDDFVAGSSLGDFCKIRNHDCMWAGHCGSKEHPADEYKLLRPIPKLEVATPVNLARTPAVKQEQQQSVAASRSLLLKTANKQTTATPAPDSPPISDDEDHKGQTLTLKILNDAIDEFEIDEDSDLCEYFEDGEDLVTDPASAPPVVAPPVNNTSKTFFHLQSDHCYHKDKNASMMRMVGLGIETPSDSEEEIDVVSISEKHTTFGLSRPCYALPTNPSNKDRQQLQRTMASAITNRHPVNSKSSMKRSSNCDVTPKRRGIKRSRKPYKTSPTHSPYKKRAPPSNSSDSEPELEKRSLHNNMERQRRIDLRNAFEELRVLVPQVNSKDRAAKVVILREAAAYCDVLGDVSEGMNKKLAELRRQQERLRARVSQLRRSLAAKR